MNTNIPEALDLLASIFGLDFECPCEYCAAERSKCEELSETTKDNTEDRTKSPDEKINKEQTRSISDIVFRVDDGPYEVPEIHHRFIKNAERFTIGLPYYDSEDEISVKINREGDKMIIKANHSGDHSRFSKNYHFGINLAGPSEVSSAKFVNGELIIETVQIGKTFEDVSISFTK